MISKSRLTTRISTLIFIVLFLAQLNYAQEVVEDDISFILNVKAGPIFQSTPFELPGFNNSLTSGNANSFGALAQADLIIQKGWIGLITTFYGRFAGADESFYTNTYNLSKFSSHSFYSRGVMTGLYIEKKFVNSMIQALYCKYQWGGFNAGYPSQDLTFKESSIDKIAIDPAICSGFVSSSGLGIKLNGGTKLTILVDLNFIFENGNFNLKELTQYIDDIPSNYNQSVVWQHYVYNLNVGLSYKL